MEAKLSVESAVDSLSHPPGSPVHGGSRERQWDARELEMGRGRAGLLPGDFPKTRLATSREMPLAPQREGMGRAMEQG